MDAALRAGATFVPDTPDPGEAPEAVAAPAVLPDAPAVLSPAGVVVRVLGREDPRLEGEHPRGRDAVLTSGMPVTTGAVVLDPGHGGYDPGAVGPNGPPDGPGSGYVDGGQMPPRPRTGPRGGGAGEDPCDDRVLWRRSPDGGPSSAWSCPWPTWSPRWRSGRRTSSPPPPRLPRRPYRSRHRGPNDDGRPDDHVDHVDHRSGDDHVVDHNHHGPARPAAAGFVEAVHAALGDPRFESATVGLSVWVEGSGIVLSQRADTALRPASNEKLLVGWGTYGVIGLAASLITDVRADGQVDGLVLLSHPRSPGRHRQRRSTMAPAPAEPALTAYSTTPATKGRVPPERAISRVPSPLGPHATSHAVTCRAAARA